jgi:hypothetical protein
MTFFYLYIYNNYTNSNSNILKIILICLKKSEHIARLFSSVNVCRIYEYLWGLLSVKIAEL